MQNDKIATRENNSGMRIMLKALTVIIIHAVISELIEDENP